MDWSITFYTGGIPWQEWDNAPEEIKSKPWKIRWWFRHPESGRLVRQSDIKAGVNRLNTAHERIEFMEYVKSEMIAEFKSGYNPYITPVARIDEDSMTSKEALELALSLSKEIIGPSTYKNYKGRSEAFIEHLSSIGMAHRPISEVSKKVVSDYLDLILKKTSARTRNNVRSDLSSLFTILSNKFIIERNFIKTDIPRLRTRAKTDRRLSTSQMRDLADYLKKSDPQLLLFIKVISYSFLRPIEVCRLKVSDIDIRSREMYFDQKTKLGKTKIIPNIYLEDLKTHINGYSGDFSVFSPEGCPSIWDISDDNKRDYFSKRFAKAKKKFKLGSEYGLYSFRHSFITATYGILRKREGLGKIEAIDKLMSITGHNSKEGIEKYIHANDADRPEDWSNLIDFRF